MSDDNPYDTIKRLRYRVLDLERENARLRAQSAEATRLMAEEGSSEP